MGEVPPELRTAGSGSPPMSLVLQQPFDEARQVCRSMTSTANSPEEQSEDDSQTGRERGGRV